MDFSLHTYLSSTSPDQTSIITSSSRSVDPRGTEARYSISLLIRDASYMCSATILITSRGLRTQERYRFLASSFARGPKSPDQPRSESTPPLLFLLELLDCKGGPIQADMVKLHLDGDRTLRTLTKLLRYRHRHRRRGACALLAHANRCCCSGELYILQREMLYPGTYMYVNR